MRGRRPADDGEDALSTDRTRDLALVVVDGDPRIRCALASLLSGVAGLRVQGTVDHSAGFAARAAAQGPDVVLVDVPPSGPGEALALLADLARAAVSAVAMSASGALRARALAAGARFFVEKDGADDVLVAALLGAGRPAPSG